ncbi:MAG: hypothetical protein IIT58_09220 [Treponema sp.]|nr:hypothetical protein [Treponema sp.]
MIGKLICFIAGIIVLAFFAGFNLDNKCDVNVLFHTFKDVPVMFTIVFSFVIGILVSIPICYLSKAQRKDKEDVQKAAEDRLLKKQKAQEEKEQKEQLKLQKEKEKQEKLEQKNAKKALKAEKKAAKDSKNEKSSEFTPGPALAGSSENTVEVNL